MTVEKEGIRVPWFKGVALKQRFYEDGGSLGRYVAALFTET